MTGQAEPTREPDRIEPADAARWLDDHGDALFRFALARVGRGDVAEDLVQDTLLAALAARSGFRGDSAVRTWLLAILRRKIADTYRRPDRPDPPMGDSPVERHVFREDGHYRQSPASWRSPDEALEAAEFREVLDGCLGRLPRDFAAAFTLREVDERPTEEVREALGLSAGNLRVRLYRARLLLRECLERNWFAPSSTSPPSRP
jgi:RNA polymerase sigma-70 factor (ECF subfamily)